MVETTFKTRRIVLEKNVVEHRVDMTQEDFVSGARHTLLTLVGQALLAEGDAKNFNLLAQREIIELSIFVNDYDGITISVQREASEAPAEA